MLVVEEDYEILRFIGGSLEAVDCYIHGVRYEFEIRTKQQKCLV